jgi:hypothetical protein
VDRRTTSSGENKVFHKTRKHSSLDLNNIEHNKHNKEERMVLTWQDFDNMYKDEHGNIPEFYFIVKRDLGILDNPKADKLMSIAWEDGHSAGYYEVYQKARDLVELIQ